MPRLSTFADVVSPALGAFQAGQRVREDLNRQQTLAEIGSRLQAGESPGDVASVALQSGDLQGFTRLSQLANQNRNFEFQKGRAQVADDRDARNFDFRQAQAAEDRRRFGVTTGLRRQQLAATQANTQAQSARPSTKIGKLNRDLQKGLITPEQHKAALEAMSAPGLKIGPDGRIVAVGKPNTKSVNTTLQKQIAGDKVILNDLGSIRKKFRPEFLTFAGRADAALTAFNEKAEGIPGKGALEAIPGVGSLVKNSPEERKFLKDRTKFNNEVEQTFNSYRKLITGAAAAVAELDRLQRTFLSGEMSPSQFEAALTTLEEKTARAVQVRQDLVNNGVSLSSPEAKQAIDQAVAGSQTGGVTSSGIRFTIE